MTRRTYLRRRIVLGVAIVFLAFFIWLSISLGSALLNPAYGTSALPRAAEWARDNHMSWLVNPIENWWYSLHPPKKGGAPPPGSFTTATVPGATIAGGLAVPARLHSPAGAWLPGEGVWHPVGRTVKGVPAIYATTVRPDGVHTSYVVGVAWMDTHLVSATLYSGSYIPGGGPYAYTAPISTPASRTLVSVFNAGFRMGDAQGGYFTQHRMVVPLRTGAASLVVYRDGSATVGAWNQQLSMTPQVVSVRQNLDLIVNGGRPVPGLLANDNHRWGVTLGGSVYVWRSGVGVTKNGALVYVGGPSLSITSLANLLADAGAVRAMELDINEDWVHYSTFTGPLGAPVTGANATKLVSTIKSNPGQFFATWWTRDFYTMSARPAPDAHPTAPLP